MIHGPCCMTFLRKVGDNLCGVWHNFYLYPVKFPSGLWSISHFISTALSQTRDNCMLQSTYRVIFALLVQLTTCLTIHAIQLLGLISSDGI